MCGSETLVELGEVWCAGQHFAFGGEAPVLGAVDRTRGKVRRERRPRLSLCGYDQRGAQSKNTTAQGPKRQTHQPSPFKINPLAAHAGAVPARDAPWRRK